MSCIEPRRYKFSEMWDMVKKHRYQQLPPIFSDELLIIMMWEESTFQNKRQLTNIKKCAHGRAVGFGQIEETEFWRWDKRNKKEYMWDSKEQMRERVLRSDSLSIAMVGMMLTDLQRRLPRATWSDTLNNYAGAGNREVADQWRAALPLLKNPMRTVRLPQGYWIPPKTDIKKALHAAKPNGDGFFEEILSDIPD